ncbi:YgjP-like metallopeptidase domain-containing protein [Actinokineospora sp. NBRC 105648]|uniref:M48 family metallopeptidase n=1 Tax=Actinokineospora sp. NBRC 105648 TaxID=3032206 RepID=UPI0024A2569D|nr:YgjP-like metallopeptidase domain-containing protein [Actinokineospora sp. NBRC 105648]GLZ37866.1 hypothetical protein Acsp05_14900 [Actinokineospora sp. NBRC 105648]
MTEQDVYEVAIAELGLPAEWTITVAIRPRRRLLAIEVQPGGVVTVLIPPGTDPGKVADYVRRQRAWLTTNVDRAAHLAPAFTVKRWVDGERFDLLGTQYDLRLVEGGPAACIQRDPLPSGRQSLQVRRAQPEVMRRAVIGLYREHGLAWAREHGLPYELRGGIQQLRYEVRDLGRRRWGIYNHAKHLVTLHWPLFGLPIEVIEYVLVHELAHATRPGGRPHGPTWRWQVAAFMPDWRDRQADLAIAGHRAWMGECHQP